MTEKLQHILILEDEPSSRALLKAMLKSIGYNSVSETEDAETALEVLKEKKVNLILSDWLLPGMSGLEFFRAVRENEAYKEIPFLLVSGQSEKAQVIEAIKSGVDGYILKPFSVHDIRKRIDQIFQ